MALGARAGGWQRLLPGGRRSSLHAVRSAGCRPLGQHSDRVDRDGSAHAGPVAPPAAAAGSHGPPPRLELFNLCRSRPNTSGLASGAPGRSPRPAPSPNSRRTRSARSSGSALSPRRRSTRCACGTSPSRRPAAGRKPGRGWSQWARCWTRDAGRPRRDAAPCTHPAGAEEAPPDRCLLLPHGRRKARPLAPPLHASPLSGRCSSRPRPSWLPVRLASTSDSSAPGALTPIVCMPTGTG